MRRSLRAGLTILTLATATAGGYVSWAQAPRPAASAQPAGVAAPAATPAANAPKRQELVMPPGFQKVTVGDHTALCEPNDVAWVRQALGEVKSPARPHPAIAAVLKSLDEKRPALTKQIVTDLALADDKSVGEFLDGKLIPMFKKLDDLRPPFFFLVTTQNRLKELTKTGWGEPRFHYNGVADAAAYDNTIPPLTIDRPMDDTVLPALYDASAAVDVRTKGLTAGVQDIDTNVANLAAAQTTTVTFTLLVQFLRERHLDPLKLRRDQEWLAMGVSNYLAAKYASQVTGQPREELLRRLVAEPEGFPVNARSVNLARPVEESAMKPELVPFYTMAMQRKSLAVVAYWVEQAGEAAIPRTLTALRTRVPADGAGLAKTIQEASGIDLSKYLAG